MKPLKPELNVWQCRIGFQRCRQVRLPAWRLCFKIFKLKSFPKAGECIGKENYKGIFWQSRIIYNPITLLKRFLDKRFYNY